MAAKTASEVMKFAKDNKVEIVDLKFCDVPGLWQHFSVSANEFSEEVFEDGIGFDGSSIRGFQTIDESDMLLIPDPESAFLDPFADVPTVSLTCNVRDPVTGQPYTRDPRFVAQKAEIFLKSTGVADISYWGPEIEFYILDNVRFDQSYNYGFYYIDSEEGFWNSGQADRPNLGYKPRYKEGYFPVPPMDHLQNSTIGNDAHAGEMRSSGRGSPPRGGHGRASRNRYAIYDAHAHGRPSPNLQIHH